MLSGFLIGLTFGSLCVAAFYGERFPLPLRPYFSVLALLIGGGIVLRGFGY